MYDDDLEPIEFIADGWAKFSDLLVPNKWDWYTLCFHPEDEKILDQIVALHDEWGVNTNTALSNWDDLRLKTRRRPKLSASNQTRQHESQFTYWDSYCRVRFWAYPELSHHLDKVYLNLCLDAVHLISNDPFAVAREEDRIENWWKYIR